MSKKNCEACGDDVSDEDTARVGPGTPLAKALGIDDPSTDGPFVVCNECNDGALKYIDSGAFQQSGYKPMPSKR
jgi:hypothetical protein